MTTETPRSRRPRALFAWATAGLTWLGALAAATLATAAPPVCKDGKVAVDGGCCWPEQRFVSGRCDGPPRCPSGRISSKGDCLSRAGYAEALGAVCAKLELGVAARPPEDPARRACDELASMLGDAEPGWTMACDKGDAAACLLLGGARQGYRTASTKLELWVARCPSNDCNGVRRSAERLGFAGTKLDPVGAKKSFERACKEGAFAACAELMQRGVPKGFYRDLCVASGDAAACTEAGYQIGIVGRVADAELMTALEAALTKSCAEGNGLACNNLGFFIERKLLGDRTPRSAAQRYREACERGAVLGCANLVLASVRTPGLPRTPGFEAAAKALEAGCDVAREDTHQVCFAFGHALQKGLGRKADVRRGQKLQRDLCAAGFSDACGR